MLFGASDIPLQAAGSWGRNHEGRSSTRTWSPASGQEPTNQWEFAGKKLRKFVFDRMSLEFLAAILMIKKCGQANNIHIYMYMYNIWGWSIAPKMLMTWGWLPDGLFTVFVYHRPSMQSAPPRANVLRTSSRDRCGSTPNPRKSLLGTPGSYRNCP